MVAVSLAFAQQGNAGAEKQQKKEASVYEEVAKARPKAGSRRNRLKSDLTAVAAGRNLFDQHCAKCHGDAAEGGKKGPTLRAEEVQASPPGAIFWLLTNGVVRRGTPVWSKLPEPQRWQLVSYIKSLGSKSAEAASSH